MVWAVTFRGKHFNLDYTWDPEDIEAIMSRMRGMEELPGSFDVLQHESGLQVTDITFEESFRQNELPFDLLHGFDDSEYGCGEVYIFKGFPDHGDGELIVLYENGSELDPPVNETRFPLKDNIYENLRAEGQGDLFGPLH
ncbi:hypothetical protein [Phyllobacterium sp. P30BS-XVII]|uniref:hypothetical protein n=1 Tax=Phyllobacterium sp. P30BS-XVII TaxID=2587046 RepID=UPI0015FD2A2E|nr:hypothetical protein [Phyllobacterium sp. P30BS-XVII]MBA8904184.1 hypothetical protein [Phyllobacterium sp. P30BS-XVII]